MIITLDGPAGSGKSTLSKLIAKHFGISYLDTGAMYRALTWILLNQEISFNASEEIQTVLDHLTLRFDGEKIFWEDKDLSLEIRQARIDRNVAKVAAIPAVRNSMQALQRRIAQGNFVVEGRDMGSAVFPHAEYKFYIDASCEERARRRYKQIEERGETPPDYEVILSDIKKRDFEDQNRKMSPLTIPKDAVVIHTDNLSLEDVLEKILSHLPSSFN